MKVRVINKKGSTAVFLTMILASILMVVGVLVHYSTKLVSQSYADAALDLAGRSVLSEYNVKLREDYGLFGVKGVEEEMENKLAFYANSSFRKGRGQGAYSDKRGLDLLKLELKGIHVDLKAHTLANADILEKQILEDIGYRFTKEILGQKEERMPNTFEDIELRNEKEINQLPSHGYRGNNLDISQIIDSGLPSLQSLKTLNLNKFLTNEYILYTFQNHRGVYEERKSFFTNEVEYILCGGFADDENYQDARRYILLLRTGLNLAHIYSDPIKREEVMALAAILTPGPVSAASQLAIATTWAVAEAENDLKLLEEGKKVALIKLKINWALDLDGIVEGVDGSGPIEPENKSGMDYEDYLRVLLFFQNREMKLLRTMDLIQLNMRGNYHKDFLMKDYYGGFVFDAVVQDRRYHFVQEY